jgi:hypothetical protein
LIAGSTLFLGVSGMDYNLNQWNEKRSVLSVGRDHAVPSRARQNKQVEEGKAKSLLLLILGHPCSPDLRHGSSWLSNLEHSVELYH